jgi:hypothetical protein
VRKIQLPFLTMFPQIRYYVSLLAIARKLMDKSGMISTQMATQNGS